jgi:2-oxoglutarate ferredoxin oxidoreductase subunit alpha
LPTKTEQSDLYQAVYGRNADTPIPVVAAATSGDCFEMAIEATRIALRHMTPVILLADGYLSNAAEPWMIPDIGKYEPIATRALPDLGADADPQRVAFTRDEDNFGRPWVIPGMEGLMHRIGGLEKDFDTGHISYDPANHGRMTELRHAQVESVANYIPEQSVELGPDGGKVVVVGWGSTYGPVYQAVVKTGVSMVHLRHLNPFPSNLGELLARFDHVLVPEMNTGQLCTILRDKLCREAISFPKVSGQPFLISDKIESVREGATS